MPAPRDGERAGLDGNGCGRGGVGKLERACRRLGQRGRGERTVGQRCGARWIGHGYAVGLDAFSLNADRRSRLDPGGIAGAEEGGRAVGPVVRRIVPDVVHRARPDEVDQAADHLQLDRRRGARKAVGRAAHGDRLAERNGLAADRCPGQGEITRVHEAAAGEQCVGAGGSDAAQFNQVGEPAEGQGSGRGERLVRGQPDHGVAPERKTAEAERSGRRGREPSDVPRLTDKPEGERAE